MPPTKTQVSKPVPKQALATPQINPKYAFFKMEIAPSEIHRWGIYAQEKIPPKRKVMEYTGERCNRKETRKRGEADLNYLFTLNSYWALDGSVGGSGAEYINHCCDPNLYAWVFKEHILYMSKRTIKKGEELTIDYHFEKDVPKVPCSCGVATCRGTINLLK